MEKQKITLEYPIAINGIESYTLYMRRCKVKDIKSLDKIKGDMASAVFLVATLCDVAPNDVEELDASDFMRLSEMVTDFLPSNGAT